MPSSQLRGCTAGADSGSNWTNPGNCVSDNTSYATTSSATSSWLKASGFGFSIPTGATIQTIVVTINGLSSGSTNARRTVVAQLSKDNSARVGSGKNLILPSSDGNIASSPADLFGTTWTPAEMNSANFSVHIQSTQAYSKSVDWVTVTVTWTWTLTGGFTGGGAPYKKEKRTLTAVSSFNASNVLKTKRTLTGTSTFVGAESGIKPLRQTVTGGLTTSGIPALKTLRNLGENKVDPSGSYTYNKYKAKKLDAELTLKKSFRLIPGDYGITAFTQKLLTREFTSGFGDMLGWWNFDDALGLELADEFFFCAQQATLNNAVVDVTAAKYGSFGLNISTADTLQHNLSWLFNTSYGQSKKQPLWLAGSVGMWVKCITLPAVGNFNKLFLVAGGPGSRVECKVNSNGALFLINRTNGVDQTLTSSSGVIQANTWHFIEARWSQQLSLRDLWVDNVRVGLSNAAFNAPTVTISSFSVGQAGITALNTPYYIDYVRFSNTLRRMYPYKDLAAWPGNRPSQELKDYTYKKLKTVKVASQSLTSTANILKVARVNLSAVLSIVSELPKKTIRYPNVGNEIVFLDGTPLEIPNGGFEAGDFSSWDQSPQGLSIIPFELMPPYRGQYSAELFSTRGFLGNKAAFIGQAFTLTPGDKYYAAFSYKYALSIGDTFKIYFYDTDPAGTLLLATTSYGDTGGIWKREITGTVTVPVSGILYVQAFNAIPGTPGDNFYYLDSMRLIKETGISPSTLTAIKIKRSAVAGAASFLSSLQGVRGKFKHLDSTLQFNSTGYRVRDGVYLPSYPSEVCNPVAFDSETCNPVTFTVQTADSVAYADGECSPASYYDNQDSGLAIFNQDGCAFVRQRQTYSYAPPARSNVLNFNGNLLKNNLSLSTRFLADLQFNAALYKKSTEPMASSLSFSGIKSDKPKRVYPAGASFGGSLAAVKTSVGIQNAWAWWKADDISDDTDSPNIDTQVNDYDMPVDSIWRDRSGNGRHLFFKPQGVGNIKYKTNQANSKPCVWFSGSVAWAAFATSHTLSGDFYIVYAFRYSTGVISNDGFDVLLSANNQSIYYIRMPYGDTTQHPESVENNWLWRNGSGDTEIRIPNINGEALKSVTTFHTHAIQRVGGTFTAFFDNASRGSVSGSTGAYLTSGIRTYFTPARSVNETFMLEGVVYNRIPDSTEKANVQSYLASKWGI